MVRLLLKVLFLTFACSCVGLVDSHAQEPAIPSGWKAVSACHIRFLTPKDLKNQHARGIDSCYAEFRNGRMRLAIDSGTWGGGGAIQKTETYLDFKEEFIEIDSKKAQVVTYKDAGNKSSRKFVAGFYVVLYEAQKNKGQLSAFLYMTVRATNEKDLEIAKQIFQSIRFNVYSPSTIEQ